MVSAYNSFKCMPGPFCMQRVREMLLKNLPEDVDGTGVCIAVLDSGVGNHPDLRGKVIGFRDFVRQRNFLYDDNGHGTHVCGILSGSGEMFRGKYKGMAPGAKLVVGKVLDEKGDGATEEMLNGLDWILEIREKYNIKILNISVGIGNLAEAGKERALQAKIEELWNCGILVVCAAGNKGPGNGTISSVCSSNKVVTVGCHDGSFCRENPNRCETYSGRGPAGGSVRKPDLVAPGTDIISCCSHFYKLHGKYRNPYIPKSGTSMATPIVAGACALVLQKFPEYSNEECKQKLQLTAMDLGLPWNLQGWGMLNVDGLLR